MTSKSDAILKTKKSCRGHPILASKYEYLPQLKIFPIDQENTAIVLMFKDNFNELKLCIIF